MTRGVVIDRHHGLLWAIILDGKTATDIYAEPIDAPDLTGAVVRAKVMRVLPGQNAAIVRWSAEQEGYWSDAKNVRAGDWKTLQVKSGAYADKLPQLSNDISFAGRFLIHLPKKKGIKQSRRSGYAISLPSGLNGGWIVRRHAAQATTQQLHVETHYLMRQAAILQEPIEETAVLHLRPAWQRAIIDHGATLQFIEVPNAVTEKMVLGWLQDFAPDCVSLLRRRTGSVDIGALCDTLTTVSIALPEGSCLTIEPTRAFWVCDVDAGAQQNHLQANILAARELARQMRLRNMGGIVVVDFISLRTVAEKQKLLAAMRAAVADDPAGVEIFGLTKLGLLELTRQRRGASLSALMHNVISKS